MTSSLGHCRAEARFRHLVKWGLTACTQDLTVTTPSPETITSDNTSTAKAFGQLVVLGFDVTVFTPAPYQRHRL